MPAADRLDARIERLALLPLRTVLFPGGQLWLTVVDERYAALARRCLAKLRPFGALLVLEDDAPALAAGGVLALVETIEHTGAAMRVCCRGTQRFRVLRERAAGEDGLRRAHVEAIADDAVVAPVPAMFAAVAALGRALATMRSEDKPAPREDHFDEAGWVANRWCELLPIPLPAKQRLMELQDPAARLALVDRYLRERRIIG